MGFYTKWICGRAASSPIFKALFVMKLITIILLLGCLQVSAKTYAQNIDLQVNNASLQKVFTQIEKQSDYFFIYRNEWLKDAQKVDVKLHKATIEQTLSAILKGQPLTYTIIDNNIVIGRKALEDNSQSIKKQLAEPPLQGIVVDSATGEPLAGVSIKVKGTTAGTTTDAQGRFNLENLPDEAVLVVSYLGYKSQTIAVKGNSNLKISLAATATGLNQLVVVGYGTTKKKDLTGAITQVNSKEIQAVPVYNVGEALKGRASGVHVMHNSGQPGSRIQITIRGGNSMIGSNEPLYVVNGFPITGGIQFLNPSDIKTIDILKDASATAIYGARGANGVVMITTKRGRLGQENRISIQSYYGIQNVAKRYDLLNAKQYAIVANEWLKNAGKDPFFDVDEVNNPGTDWQDVIFRPAPIQNHTITFSGSSEKTNYSISANYFKQEGIVINSGAQRGSFRVNLNHDIKKWLQYSVDLNLSRQEQQTVPVNNGSRGNTMFTGALSAPPTLPVRDSAGLPTRIAQIYSFGSADMRNPLLWSKPYKNKTLANTILLNNALNFKITDALSFKTRLGLQYENSAHHSFNPIRYESDRGSASTSDSYWNSILNSDILTFDKHFQNVHHLKLMGGFTYQSYRVKNDGISVSGFSNNITHDYDLGAAETVNPPSSGISEWKLISWLGRANYSFNNKYYITASIRADGSSRFGADNKWGIFPSGALAWRVSEEPFLEEVSFISNLKIRASYGVTGNTALSPYQSLARLSSVRYIYEGHTESIGYAPSAISNSQLKWETTREFDIGLNLSILNDRLGLTFDYYNKHTHDLLASVPLPPSVGYGFILENIGQIQNQGLEFSVNADIFTGDFKWDVAAQLSTNKNKVIKIAGGSDIVSSGTTSQLPGYNLAREGEPLGVFYGYREDGLDSEGQIKYIDKNGDGSITPLDRFILGSPYPNFTFGFNSNFSYKNFALSIFLQGVHGNDIFWRTAYSNLNSFQRGNNQFVDIVGNYWTEKNPNPNAKYPKISKYTQMRPSNRFIKDGSYLRLKSVQLSYDIPLKLSWFHQAEIYVKATNLLTLTNYPGLDPEVNTRGTDSQSIKSRLKIGTDQSGYPNARTFGAGVQLSF